jgi:hypothetical protein
MFEGTCKLTRNADLVEMFDELPMLCTTAMLHLGPVSSRVLRRCMRPKSFLFDQQLTGNVQTNSRADQAQPENQIIRRDQYSTISKDRKCFWGVARMYEKRGRVRDRVMLVEVNERNCCRRTELTVMLIPPITPTPRSGVCVVEGTRYLYTCSRLNGLPSDARRQENHSIGTQ